MQPVEHTEQVKRAGPSLRVLLAEDNKINQQYAMFLLNKAGYSVTIAENGHQAVDTMRDGDFDVVLMDIQMPELDGIQATRQIRALPAPKNGVPIIAMTAHAMAGAREEYLAAGMDDYVSKPFEAALVLAKLARIADGVAGKTPIPLPQASQNDDAPLLLDFDKLQGLKAVLPMENVAEFISLYLVHIEGHLKEIDACAEAGDFGGVARQAHAMVSMTGNLGAMRSSAMARALELASAGQDAQTVIPLVGELHASCRLSSEALRTWLDAQADPRRVSAAG